MTSCVGYAVVSSDDRSELDSNCRGNMYCINEQDSIKKVLGNPHKIIFENNKEYWVYNKKLALRGILLGLIIPVPLIIPVGYDKAIFEFENGKRTHTSVDNSKTTSAFLCGFILAGHAGFGCYVQ
ncbi:MAG: hypothetical protein HY096_15670 [Nitrospinae bacterium]|nr:hypothetical protein [Nitrospinota bacterium]